MKRIGYNMALTIILAISCLNSLSAQQYGSFKDPRDGIEYKTVQIGEQIWFAENLAYNLNSNSTHIEYDPNHVKEFGRLYVWEDVLNACPPGWHLPSKEEFATLLKTTGGGDSESFAQLISGGSSGFSALLGGWRNNNGADGNVGNYAYYWSSSTDRPGRVWTLDLYGYTKKASINRGYTESTYKNRHGEYIGISIRCIKDQ